MKTVEIDKEEQKKIGSNVLKLAIPVLFENLFQLLFSFVDMIFVGFLGSTALAAVGLGLQVINVILAVVGGLTTGTMVMVAYSIGAKKYKEAEKYLTNSLSLGLFLSVIMLILGISGTDKLLYLLGARGELLSYSSVYLKYILIPGFLIIFMSVISAALRGAGDTRTPLYITMTSNTLNIFLDYILVFGKFGFPKMGVAGAALATSISRLVGVILLFIIIYRRNSVFKFQDFGYSIFTFERDKTSKILNIGLPILVENLLFNIGVLIYASIVLSLGTEVYAAHRIVSNAESLSFQPGFAFGVAATALVGQYKGARENEKSLIASLECWKRALILMSTVGLLLFLFPEPLIKMFTREQNVINLAVPALRIIAIAQPLLATSNVISGSLRGSGFTKIPMIFSAIGMWGIRIPLTYILCIKVGIGLSGAWIAMAVDISFKAIANYYTFIVRKYFLKESIKPSKNEKIFYN